VAEFGHPEVQALANRPLKDAAAVNATRYAIGHSLKRLELPVSLWPVIPMKHFDGYGYGWCRGR